jgi:hypothetical protein
MNDRKYTIFSILFLFFLSALIMLRQLKSPDYFSCIIEDSYTYTSWAWQFIQALKEGVIYPRWLPLNFWGYGSPTFILYPPLAFYLVAFFNVFTHSLIAAMNITKLAALVFSGVGMFFLVKEFYSERTALLSAAFYTVFPYNIFQFYFVGTFASVSSFVWFSPIVLFIYRCFKNRQFKNIAYGGVCYGGLILTHLINAYMFTFVMTAFIICMSLTKKRPKDLVIIPLVIMIGLLISAAYLLPVIYEKQFLNIKFFTGEGGGFRFDFHNFFILPSTTGELPSGHLWPVYYNTFVFFIFFFCILILLFLRQIIKLRSIGNMEDVNTVNMFFLVTAVCSIFLLFGISGFIWETIPFFDYIQFPVRWLNITAYAVVFLSAAIFRVPDTLYKTKRQHIFFVALLFLACFLVGYKYISSAHMFTKQKLEPVKASNWNLEHMPSWVSVEKIDRNDAFKERITIIEGEGKVEIVAWKSADRVIEITAPKAMTVRIRAFNFPGWKAYIDGVETEIKTEEGSGAMLVDIPQGEHKLALKFEDTPVRYYSKIISLVSFLAISLVLLFSRKRPV